MLCNFFLIANMMYQVKESAVNRNLIMWGEALGGMGVCYSPVIVCQSSNKSRPLNCGLHKCFSGLFVFSTPGWRGWLE